MSESPAPVARKEYYSIGEVCELVGLKPHVLRYWESQFPSLNPAKNRSGHPAYLRRELELSVPVEEPLDEERYTSEGARGQVGPLRRGRDLAPAGEPPEQPGLLAVLLT